MAHMTRVQYAVVKLKIGIIVRGFQSVVAWAKKPTDSQWLTLVQ